MSCYGSADVGFLFVSGLSVLGDMTQIEDSLAAITEETTVLGDDWEQHAPVGVKRYQLTQRGFYNDAVGRSNEALVSPGSSGILSFAPEGNALGKLMVCTSMVQVNYIRQIQRAALHKAEASYLSEQGHDEARIIHALAARTEDGDTEAAAYDGTAQSSAGGTAYLQVTALDLGGYDDVTIAVREFVTDHYEDIVAFDDVSAVGAQRKPVAGMVERFLAVAWTFNGSGSNPSITFAVGFKRN